jgi:hypothetical protein
LIAGGLIIWTGSKIDGIGSYDRSVFVNAGVAIGLVGPLFVGQQLLSVRIDEARDRAVNAEAAARSTEQTLEETRAELRSLDERVSASLARVRADDIALRQRVAEGDRQEDLVDLYRRATASPRSIDRLGLRVPVEPLEWPLRVRAIERAPEGDRIWLIELQFEDDDLHVIGDPVAWSPGEAAEDVFVRLATGLRTAGRWPGDQSFRPQALLSAIATDLARVIDIREGPAGDLNVRQIIELIGDWAITREGLDSLRSASVWAERQELIGRDVPRAYPRLEQQAQALGLDEAEFNRAFDTAQRVHAALALENPGRQP